MLFQQIFIDNLAIIFYNNFTYIIAKFIYIEYPIYHFGVISYKYMIYTYCRNDPELGVL